MSLGTRGLWGGGGNTGGQQQGSRYIYRTGSLADVGLTPKKGGVSFRDSVSSSADGQQTLSAGGKLFAVDTTRLPRGSEV
jgi:hypothetical protein